MTTTIVIKVQEIFCPPGMGGSIRPFRSIYRIEYEGEPLRDEHGHAPTYEGTPLRSLRTIAARLAKQHGATIQDTTKKAKAEHE